MKSRLSKNITHTTKPTVVRKYLFFSQPGIRVKTLIKSNFCLRPPPYGDDLISAFGQPARWPARKKAAGVLSPRQLIYNLFFEFNPSFGINAHISQLLFDAQQLVVFGQPVGPGSAARLDLAAVQGHGEVRDGRVFGFAATMRHNGRITVSLS